MSSEKNVNTMAAATEHDDDSEQQWKLYMSRWQGAEVFKELDSEWSWQRNAG